MQDSWLLARSMENMEREGMQGRTPDAKVHNLFGITHLVQLGDPNPDLFVHIRLEVCHSSIRKSWVEILPLPLMDCSVSGCKDHWPHLHKGIVEGSLGKAALVAIDFGQSRGPADGDMVGGNANDISVLLMHRDDNS